MHWLRAGGLALRLLWVWCILPLEQPLHSSGGSKRTAPPRCWPTPPAPPLPAGIDIDGSSDVAVSGCTITTADDAVCLKTTHPHHPTERVTVDGCTLQSRSSAVKLGSESRAAMRHIAFTNLRVRLACHE